MPYSPGANYARGFITPQGGVGQKADPDSNFLVMLRRNGLVVATSTNGVSDNPTMLTVRRNGQGDYTALGTIPSGYSVGDDIDIYTTFTFSSTPCSGLVNLGPLESTGPVTRNVSLVNRPITVTD